MESVPFSRGDQGSFILALETSSQSLTSGRMAEALSSRAKEEAPTMCQADGELQSPCSRSVCRCQPSPWLSCPPGPHLLLLCLYLLISSASPVGMFGIASGARALGFLSLSSGCGPQRRWIRGEFPQRLCVLASPWAPLLPAISVSHSGVRGALVLQLDSTCD